MNGSVVTLRPRLGRLGSRIKSKQGCATCKVRKVKCDEAKPICRRCQSTGRICDGYAIDKLPKHTSAAKPCTSGHIEYMSSYTDVDRVELQSFEFFICSVVPGFSRFVDQHFWHQVLPQISRLEKVIWNAVNALACLIRYPQFSQDWLLPGRVKSEVTDDNHRRALKWYTKSLSSLQERIGRGEISPGMLMVTCLLYTCIECLQDNLDEAIALYQKAMGMSGLLGTSHVGKKNVATGQNDSSLETTTQALLRHMSISQGLPMSSFKLECQNGLNFTCLSQAREFGYGMLAETHEFVVQAQEIKMTRGKDWLPTEDLIDRREHLKIKLLQWEAALHDVARRRLIVDSSDEDEHYSALTLSCTHYLIFLSTCLSMDETSFDTFLPHFRAMIRYARRVIAAQRIRSQHPVFIFETQITPALQFLAIKCRHPVLRREAISLLENEAPRMEYYFKAEAMAKVARRSVGIEEAGGSELGVFCNECPPERAELLPAEQHRIYMGKLVKLLDPNTGEPTQFFNFGMWRQELESGARVWTEYVIKM